MWRVLVGDQGDQGRETFLSYTGPEGALADGLKHLGERDAQRPCQPEQVLEGRVPASGFNPTQIRPVHLGQIRQALLGQPSLAVRLQAAGWRPSREASWGFGDGTQH